MSDGPIDVKSCEECQYLHAKYDWDNNSFWCHHPMKFGNYVGQDTITPSWCPYLEVAE